MKVKINSKKNLKVNLSILVDKKTIQKKMDDKLIELKDKVQLKGFRPGKVPPQVIKNQFGKAIYGEVIDGLLKETSTKALEENKIKVAGQPKIDLKTFGEGKDLDYTMEVDILPDIKLSELQNKIDLKGFRKGKVPPIVIKNQFGKAVYGEVIDNILKESTTKAIQDKKLKVAGQPKIDLKTFGEGKDLNFEIKLDLLPEIKLQDLSLIHI